MGSFILGSSVLGPTTVYYQESILEDRGRSVLIRWSNGGNDSDLELLGYSVRFTDGDPEAQEGS